MMHQVFLGLGSNLGDRLQHLNDAVREIGHAAEVRGVSAIYEAEPYGMTSSNQFLNVAVEIETPLLPPELLNKLKAIEKKLGRSPHTHMKDREIDIDILLYEDLYYEEHAEHWIEVPHPDLLNRKFALMSLDELGSTLLHPISGEPIHVLLQRCTDRHAVTRTALKPPIPTLI